MSTFVPPLYGAGASASAGRIDPDLKPGRAHLNPIANSCNNPDSGARVVALRGLISLMDARTPKNLTLAQLLPLRNKVAVGGVIPGSKTHERAVLCSGAVRHDYTVFVNFARANGYIAQEDVRKYLTIVESGGNTSSLGKKTSIFSNENDNPNYFVRWQKVFFPELVERGEHLKRASSVPKPLPALPPPPPLPPRRRAESAPTRLSQRRSEADI